jgi:hypothetical protein
LRFATLMHGNIVWVIILTYLSYLLSYRVLLSQTYSQSCMWHALIQNFDSRLECWSTFGMCITDASEQPDRFHLHVLIEFENQTISLWSTFRLAQPRWLDSSFRSLVHGQLHNGHYCIPHTRSGADLRYAWCLEGSKESHNFLAMLLLILIIYEVGNRQSD